MQYYLISDKEIKAFYSTVKLVVGQSAACRIFGDIYSRKISRLTVDQNTSYNIERNKMLYHKKFYLDVRWWTGVLIGILFNVVVFAVIAHFVHF